MLSFASQNELKMENELRDKEDLAALNEAAAKGEKKSRAKKAAAEYTAAGKKKATRVSRPNLLVQVLNGEILTRDFVVNNLTFIFFILFLLLLMVSKGYYGKQLQKDINTRQTEVNERTAEYIENKAKLEELTTRYRLKRVLEKRGLKESVNPVKVIRIKKMDK